MANLDDLRDLMSSERIPENSQQRKRIFSGVVSACACSICLVIIIVFSTVQEYAGHSPVVWGLEAILTTIAGVFTYIIWIVVHKNGDQSLEKNAEDVTIRMKLCFLWIFGIINILHCAVDMAINFECIDEQGKEQFQGDYVVSIVTHTFEIIFLTGQLGFISSYSAYRLTSSTLVNYGISTIILTHAIRWFRTLFRSLLSNDLIYLTNDSKIFLNDCFWTSDLTSFRKSVDVYVNPTLTEYSLLAVSLMLRMWISLEKKDSQPSFVPPLDDERTPLLCDSSPKVSNHVNIHKRIIRMLSLRSAVRSSSVYICVLVAIVLCLPILTTVIMSSAMENQSYHYQLSSEIIQCMFKLELFIVIMLAFFLCNTQYKEASYSIDRINSSRFILIFCTAGAVAYSTFGLIAGLLYDKDDSRWLSIVLVIQKIFEIACIYFQTILILQHSSNKIVHLQNVSRYIPVYKVHCVLFTINIIMWLVNSYMGKVVDSVMHIEQSFYGDNYLKAVNDVVLPITIFYRFHTAMDIYQLYKTYENLHNSRCKK